METERHPSETESVIDAKRSGHASGAFRFLRTVADARRRHALSPEEALILIAIGCLGIASGDSEASPFRPVAGKDVAEATAMPRETVRRRLGRLADLRLIDLDRRGATLRDLDLWLELTAPLAGGR